jgi:hypothetical protein
MNRFLLVVPFALTALSACQTADQNAAAGAVGGAVLGAAVSSEDDRLVGALTGAAVGVAASTLIRPAETPGQCYYRDSRGQTFIAPCR